MLDRFKTEAKEFDEATEIAIGRIEDFWDNLNVNSLRNPVGDLKNVDSAVLNLAADVKESNGTFEDFNNKLSKLTKSSFNFKSALKSIGVGLANLGISLAITAVMSAISAFINHQKELAENAQKATEALNEQRNTLSSYASEAEQLYKVINNENSSSNELITSKRRLAEIQRELIKTYGSEAQAINLTTSNIEEQKKAIEGLSELKYSEKLQQQFENDINKDTGWEKFYNGFNKVTSVITFNPFQWNKNYQDDFGSNLDNMLKKYEGFSKKVKATNDDTLNKLISSYENVSLVNGKFEFSGNVDDIQETIVDIQTRLKSYEGYTDKFANSLTKVYNQAKEISDEFGEPYNQEMMYRIFNDETATKYYNDLEKAYDKVLENPDDNSAYEAYRELVNKIDADEDLAKSIRNYIIQAFDSNQLGQIRFDNLLDFAGDELSKEIIQKIQRLRELQSAKIYGGGKYNPARVEMRELEAELGNLTEKYEGVSVEALNFLNGVKNENIDLEEAAVDTSEEMANILAQLALMLGATDGQGVLEYINNRWFDGKKDVGQEIVEEVEKFTISFAQLMSLSGNKETKDRINADIKDLTDYYNEQLQEVSSKEIDLNKTVFGNIDTDNRQIIEWTDANLELFKDALQSWEEDAANDWESFKNDMYGSFSTVMGTSEEFDGVEIAYSPILQTENGGILLSQKTVQEYIWRLIDNAGEGWTTDILMKLDAEGLEIDGQHIKGLIADIGEEAIKTGEAMHYVGSTGSIKSTLKDISLLKKELSDTSDTDFSEIRDDLIGMAQAGKLDADTLKAYKNYDKILKAIGKDASITEDELEDMIKVIESMSKDNAVDNLNDYRTELSKLEEAYTAFKEGKRIDSSMLSDLQDAFGHLDSYKALEKEVMAGNTDLQGSFNALATEIAIEWNALDNLTEEQKKFYEEDLKAMGVVNAHEVVENQLAHAQEIHVNIVKELRNVNDALYDSETEIKLSEDKLKDATWQTIAAEIQQVEKLNDESDQTQVTAESLALYALKKELANKIDLTNEQDLDYLVSLAKTAGVTTTALTKLAEVRAKIAENDAQISLNEKDWNDAQDSKFKENVKTKSYNGALGVLLSDRKLYEERSKELTANAESLSQELTNTMNRLQNDIQNTVNSKYYVNFGVEYNGGNGNGDGDGENEFNELVDFFERRVTVLNNALDLLDKNLENVTGSFAKNALLNGKRNIYSEMLNNYTDALAMYQQKADEALSSLPDDIAQKVKDGAVNLTQFLGESNEDVVEAIKDYESWADKVQDCSQQLAELKKTLRQLELQKFNNVVEQFTNQFDLRQSAGIDMIDKQIALFESEGLLIGEAFYETQKSQAEKQLSLLQQEKEALANQFTEAMRNGVEKGTDEWLEMQNALTNVESSIIDCRKNIEDFDTALLNVHWNVFDRVQNSFDNLNDEISNLVGLFDDIDVIVEGTRDWSSSALAKLGLLSQAYELAEYRVQQYNDQIEELKSLYAQGRYSTIEFTDKMAELNEQLWSNVNASEQAKDSIMELNKARIDAIVEGINLEITKYRELTDELIENLDKQKD